MFTVKICYYNPGDYRESFSVASYAIRNKNEGRSAELSLRPKIFHESGEAHALIMEVREATIYVENDAGKTVDTIHLTSLPK